MGALSMQPVFRLRKTWEQVPAVQREQFKQLQEVVDFSHNFRTVRSLLKTIQPPCVPYMYVFFNCFAVLPPPRFLLTSRGIYLNDFLAVEEANVDVLGCGLINFHKRKLYAVIIRNLLLYQQTPYQYEVQPDLKQQLLLLKRPITKYVMQIFYRGAINKFLFAESLY